MDRIGGNGHGAHSLLVAGVPDVEHLVALARPDLQLVVDLGDERADGIDDDAALLSSRLYDCRSRAMRAEHQRCALRHLVDVVDEDDALLDEPVHDVLVVDDLVVAVDRWLEDGDHPRKRLDRLLHAGAEASWLRQQHPIDVHGSEAIADGRGERPRARVD